MKKKMLQLHYELLKIQEKEDKSKEDDRLKGKILWRYQLCLWLYILFSNEVNILEVYV